MLNFPEFDSWYARSYLNGFQEDNPPSVTTGFGVRNQKVDPMVRRFPLSDMKMQNCNASVGFTVTNLLLFLLTLEQS